MSTADLGLALWLTLCAIGNAWFISVSVMRCRRSRRDVAKSASLAEKSPMVETYNNDNNNIGPGGGATSRRSLLEAALLGMALMDLPWVWFCMIQCWFNVFNTDPTASFSQHSGSGVVGCDFMGFYSYSMVAMMGSNGLVAYYTLRLCFPSSRTTQVLGHLLPTNGNASWRVLTFPFALVLLPVSVLFAAFPKMQGDGYALTNGGFCYADWTSPAQAAMIFSFCVVLLVAGVGVWWALARQLLQSQAPTTTTTTSMKATPTTSTTKSTHQAAARTRRSLLCLVLGAAVLFFCVWFLWIPAAIIGMAEERMPAPPYMIIGGIAGHGQALANPILFGYFLHRIASSFAAATPAQGTSKLVAAVGGSDRSGASGAPATADNAC